MLGLDPTPENEILDGARLDNVTVARGEREKVLWTVQCQEIGKWR